MPAGFNRRNIISEVISIDACEMKTEISHKELVYAWAPLVDVSMTLDRLMEKPGGDNAGAIIGFLDNKVQRALEPPSLKNSPIKTANP